MQTSCVRPLRAMRGKRAMERGREDRVKREERKENCERGDAQGCAGMKEKARRLREKFPPREGEGGDGKRER